MPAGLAEFDARTIAHEVGHALGLNHVNPNSNRSPNEVMDYNFLAGRRELFLNIVSEITEQPRDGEAGNGISHNPLYHLKRYTEGYSHEELVAQGIMPGDWELSPNGNLARPNDLTASLDFGAFDRQLFNVYVLKGERDDEEGVMEQLLYSPSLMVSQLGGLCNAQIEMSP